MSRFRQKIAALALLGTAGIGVGTPSCASRLGPVQATQSAGGLGQANLPDDTVEGFKECVALDGRQLEPGRTVLETTVDVDEDGDKVGVIVKGMSETAHDFGICIRKVLQNMPIAGEPLQEAVARLNFHRKHANDSTEALRQFIEVISGLPIVESKLVLEVDEITVELPVTVKVQADLDTLIETDKRTLQKIGQMALDSLGYDEIMKRAANLGWIKWEPIEPEPAQSQSATNKQFIGDVSPSPAPPSPARLPPPPPPRVITKTVTRRIVTRAAPRVVTRAAPRVVVKVAPRIVAKVLPAAIAAAAADGPLPPGDIIAVGSLAVALIAELVLDPEEVLVANRSQAHRLTAAASAAAATTSAPQPAPTVAKPRKYPNQTCEDDEMARLEKEMHENFCDKGYAATCGGGGISEKKLPFIPCSKIKLSLQQRQACLAARWKVQNECFGGKPDTKHKEEIDKVQRGIDYCEALKLKNCAKGHPMANL